MVDSINVTGLTVAGRIDAPDPKNGQIAIQKNLDMSNAASFSIDFNSVNQQQTIGVIRTLFADNTSNPSEIVVQALGTGQRFTIPAYAEGYFPIISRLNAGIVLTTNGGATSVVGVTFFNYDIPAVVWYKYGAVNKDIAQRVQGALSDGTDISGPYSSSQLIAGRDPTNKVKTLSVDANGALQIANLNVTIGAVFGVDAVGVVPTKSPNLFAVLDSTGKVAIPTLNADGELKVRDDDVATAVIAGSTSNNTKLDTIIGNTKNANANGVITSVAASLASTSIKAANLARMQLLIYNDSTATMYVALTNAASTVSYTVQIAPGGYYEAPMYYTGPVFAVWSAVNGNARVTELS